MRLTSSIQLMKSLLSSNINGIERHGFLGISVARTLSTRPDLLPYLTCRSLFKLHDLPKRVPSHDITRLVEGRSPEGKQLKIKRAPILTTPFWQVHQAWVDDTEVALKVARQDYLGNVLVQSRELARHERPLRALFPVLRKGLNLPYLLETMRKQLSEMIHMDFEADILYKSPFSLRQPIWATAKIAAFQKTEGRSLQELLGLREFSISLVRRLIASHADAMFSQGRYILPDPQHIIVSKEKMNMLGSHTSFSMSPQVRGGMRDFIASLADGDYRKCASLANYLASTPLSGEQFELFRESFVSVFSEPLDLGAALLAMVDKGTVSGMVFPKDVTDALAPLLHLESIANKAGAQLTPIISKALEKHDGKDSRQDKDDPVAD